MYLDISNQRSELSKNQKFLLSLLHLAKGKADGYTRLRLAVYSLKDTGLHDYKFESSCPEGPGDANFREDINSFGMFIDYDSYQDKLRPMLIHRRFKITGVGNVIGKENAEYIKKDSENEYRKLVHVAKMLGESPSKIPAKRFYELTENKW